MNPSVIHLKQSDGYLLKLYYYPCADVPKGTLLFLHGMAEHIDRYNSFICNMTANNYDVYIYSHRGHGTHRSMHELGLFDEHNGDAKVIRDALHVSAYIRKRKRSDTFFLMGHSMGSIIARNVIQFDESFDGVILCATTHPNPLLSYAGLLLSYAEIRLNGAKHRSKRMHQILFSSGEYKRINQNTPNDWLTRDEKIVQDYNEDPYCGFICTASFYNDLIKLTICAGKKQYIKRTRRDLPILIISGSEDPVSSCGKEIGSFIRLLQSCHFTAVTSKIYPDSRHELLNEFNKDEVMSDILDYLDGITFTS